MAQSGRQGKVTLFLFECFAILAVLSPDSGSFDMHAGYAIDMYMCCQPCQHVLKTSPTNMLWQLRVGLARAFQKCMTFIFI